MYYNLKRIIKVNYSLEKVKVINSIKGLNKVKEKYKYFILILLYNLNKFNKVKEYYKNSIIKFITYLAF